MGRGPAAMVSPAVVGTVFGVIFLAELPDKSLFASLVLGTRYRGLYVWCGVASAFLVHVVIAVAAGQALTLLPHRLVEGIVAALFLAGALFLLLGREEREETEGEREGEQAAAGVPPSFRRVALTSFGVVFVGEWGDITQIVTANYAAKYGDPLAVGIGAVAGLWAVAALAITAGSRLLDYVSVTVVRRVTGVILLGFAAYSAVTAITG